MDDATTLPAPELSLEGTAQGAWGEERRAFFRLLPTLLASHPGKYVAVYKGSVVAVGPDQVEVARQAYTRVGYTPVYVGLVTDDPPRPVRIPSPRLLSGRDRDGSVRIQPAFVGSAVRTMCEYQLIRTADPTATLRGSGLSPGLPGPG
jgi:Family of unknown function (DUF5678)